MENCLSLAFILTDTLPFEIPIIYSNKKLYNHLLSNKEVFFNVDIRETKNENQKNILKESVPFYFYIKKNEFEYRKMSLMNPYAQIITTKFIQQFDNTIIDYFTHNKLFSIRTPIGINSSFNEVPDEFLEEIKWLINSSTESHESLKDPLMRHYFCLSKFPKITDFYKSHYAKDLESKYLYMKKLDFQNCFENIYSHSLDWAYLGGKEIAKDNLGEKSRFSQILDMIAQRINYNETNGILIGPEFSRTVAELLLTRLDNQVIDSLREEHLYFKKDYDIVRFIDDIFIFYNDPIVGDKINDVISKEGIQFRMSLNKQKSYTEVRPFFRKHMWVPKLKEIMFTLLSQFNIYNVDDTTLNISYQKYIYDNFLDNIRLLVVEYEDQKQYLISYTISTIDNKMSKIIDNLQVFTDSQIVRKHIVKLLDTILRIINYSISVDNIIKMSRIILRLKKFGDEYNFDISDIIFVKSIRLIKFNVERISELLNIIILLRFNNNLIPNYLISEILKKESDYFTISTIAYYICNKPVGLYDNQIEKINNTIMQHLEIIFTRFEIRTKNGYKRSDKNNYDAYDKFLLSEHFYIIHDFYSWPLLSSENKKIIDKLKAKMSTLKSKTGFELYNLFLSYVNDYDKPFMNWNSQFDEIVNEFFIMKYRQANEYK